ncbi:MAG: hypothetical protein N2C12_16130, partial [Planctomycetales bacterium]
DLQFYVGSWSIEGKLGDAPFKGRASFRMPVGNYCTIGTVSYRGENRLESFSWVGGWDSSTGWVTEQGVGSDGGTYTIPWKKASPTVNEGALTGMLDGKKTTATVRVEKTGKDEFRITVTDQTEGDESRPDFSYTARRVVREKKKRAQE